MAQPKVVAAPQAMGYVAEEEKKIAPQRILIPIKPVRPVLGRALPGVQYDFLVAIPDQKFQKTFVVLQDLVIKELTGNGTRVWPGVYTGMQWTVSTTMAQGVPLNPQLIIAQIPVSMRGEFDEFIKKTAIAGRPFVTLWGLKLVVPAEGSHLFWVVGMSSSPFEVLDPSQDFYQSFTETFGLYNYFQGVVALASIEIVGPGSVNQSIIDELELRLKKAWQEFLSSKQSSAFAIEKIEYHYHYSGSLPSRQLWP